MVKEKVAQLCKIWNCVETVYAQTLCSFHWRRKNGGVTPLDRPKRRRCTSTTADGFAVHFWSWVVITANPDKCWQWNGYVGLNGYGVYPMNGVNKRAHRIAWEVFNGRPPQGTLELLHACDNKQCVNPHHLSEGTHADNMRDMALKNRMRRMCT
jgi:hypothetical protein